MMILFLSSIAGSEIILILLFVLIFFGAKSIPGMSRTLGRGLRQIKDASQEVQNEIRKTTSDMKGEMNLKRTLDQAVQDIKKPMEGMVLDIEKSSSEVEERFKIKDSIPHQNKPKSIDNQVVSDDQDDSPLTNQESPKE